MAAFDFFTFAPPARKLRIPPARQPKLSPLLQGGEPPAIERDLATSTTAFPSGQPLLRPRCAGVPAPH